MRGKRPVAVPLLLALAVSCTALAGEVEMAGPWHESRPDGVPLPEWEAMNELAFKLFAALRTKKGSEALDLIRDRFPIGDREATVFAAELDDLREKAGQHSGLEYIGTRVLGDGSRYLEIAYVTYHSTPVLWQFTHYKREGAWILVNLRFSDSDLFETIELYE